MRWHIWNASLALGPLVVERDCSRSAEVRLRLPSIQALGREQADMVGWEDSEGMRREPRVVLRAVAIEKAAGAEDDFKDVGALVGHELKLRMKRSTSAS